MNKKVLLVTYYWPPSGGGGVHRWLKMSKYFYNNGIDLIVYTPSNPEYPVLDKSTLKEVSPKLKIIKRPIKEPYSFYKKFVGKRKEDKVYSGFINDKKSLRQKLSVFIRGNFFIPDARKFWIKPSIKFLSSYIKEEGIQSIVTTGPPHSMHLIGLGVKENNPQIKWIADFRDPWTNIDFYSQLMLTVWADRKHRMLERRVLTKADHIVCVGWTMLDELKALGAGRISVITNGFDPSDYNKHYPLDEKKTIRHIGSINADRNPDTLWQALVELKEQKAELLDDLVVNLVGNSDVSVKNAVQANHLNDILEFTDFVPHEEAIKKMMSAHILLLLVNKTPNAKGILTGKLFEYIGAGRPIICIGPEGGDIERVLRTIDNGYYITYGDINTCKKVIEEVLGLLPIASKNNTMSEYTREKLAEKYSRIIKEKQD